MPKISAAASQMDVEIGMRIRTARRERGLSQTKLGTAVGITCQQIQKYEKGANRISATRLYCIAEQLGLPLGYFVEESRRQRSRASHAPILHVPAALLQTNDALKLMTAFNRIENSALRKHCLQLVQAFVGGKEAG